MHLLSSAGNNPPLIARTLGADGRVENNALSALAAGGPFAV
jgi:hypothetical protein